MPTSSDEIRISTLTLGYINNANNIAQLNNNIRDLSNNLTSIINNSDKLLDKLDVSFGEINILQQRLADISNNI